jgi:hypothetical protein
LIVGLLFSTSAVHCGPINQQNPTWISALSPIFTEFSNNVIEERTKALYEKLDIAEHVREDQALVSSQPDYLYN